MAEERRGRWLTQPEKPNIATQILMGAYISDALFYIGCQEDIAIKGSTITWIITWYHLSRIKQGRLT